MRKKCCIVIPIYNKIPTMFEEVSIRNIIRKFEKKYDIYIIHSELLDITYYINKFHVNYIKISSYLYDNTQISYNSMCMSSDFYNMFKDYEYMLLSQTDSFVFNDDLEYWLNLGYDYIGGCLEFNEYNYNANWACVKNKNILNIIKKYEGYRINDGLCLKNINKFATLCEIIPSIYNEKDKSDLMFSVLNDITGEQMINLCPKELCENFSNDLDYLPDECIERLFGTCCLFKFEKIANFKPSKKCLDTLNKVRNKFARTIIVN